MLKYIKMKWFYDSDSALADRHSTPRISQWPAQSYALPLFEGRYREVSGCNNVFYDSAVCPVKVLCALGMGFPFFCLLGA